MPSLNTFEQFLKAADEQEERIQMELQGYTEEKTPIKNKRNQITGYATEYFPPANPPRNKVSETLTDLILELFPDAVLKKSSGATLLEVWKKAVASARGNETPGTIRALVRIFRSLQTLLTGFYTAEGTLATQATAWRKPILDKYGEKSEIYKQSIYILGISRERSLGRRKEYTESVRAAAKARGGKVKYTSEQIFSVIDKCDASDNPVDWIIAVLLCTGSRLIECMKLSAYSTVPNQPHMIKLVGVAKDKDVRSRQVVVQSKKQIVKPVIRLAPARIVKLVQEIRAHWDLTFVDNKEATAKVDQSVNRRLADFFGKTDAGAPETKRTTAHKLRHIYANLSYQLYGAPLGEAENEYVREVLGHDSNEVSVAYQSIVVELTGKLAPRDASSDVKYKMSEIEHDMKENKREHVEMKKDIREVETQLNLQIADASMIDLEFPEYGNTKRIRLSREAKLERLRRLDTALANAGIRAIQQTFRRYGYGAAIIHDYYRIRTENNE